MASIKVVLYTSKTLSTGEHPILLRVIQNRKVSYISTKASSTKELWDEEANLPKKKHPLYKQLLVLIDTKKAEANKLNLELETDNIDLSAKEIKRKLKKTTNSKSVFKYFDEIIARLEKTNRIGYANIFKSTKNSLVKFCPETEIEFNDITQSFLIRYEEDFLQRGVSLNSVFVFMRTFKTLINYARKEGVVKETYNPFKEISFTKYRRVKTQKRAISKKQIQKIGNLKLKPETSLFHSRNYFMFSFYNRGINFIDIAFLKWSSIKNNRLSYTRKKTKEQFTIGMLAPAIEIFNYYKKIYYDNEDGYIFPILNSTHISARSIDNRIDRVLKIVNADLKEIAALAKIDEKLTTYVARHSYATIMRTSGISTAIISESMGHDSEKTTNIYLNSFGNKVIDEANKVIL
ncbi:MAG TPA: site-specific integrase [Bacteroidia bacterium]|jgi:site-specific recombinase XerD|nr:site-specific integrase [Bacteroidia bacterium]